MLQYKNGKMEFQTGPSETDTGSNMVEFSIQAFAGLLDDSGRSRVIGALPSSVFIFDAGATRSCGSPRRAYFQVLWRAVLVRMLDDRIIFRFFGSTSSAVSSTSLTLSS
ncbi:MAG: hypothetical protein WAW52_08550 [Methanothrix sp.]